MSSQKEEAEDYIIFPEHGLDQAEQGSFISDNISTTKTIVTLSPIIICDSKNVVVLQEDNTLAPRRFFGDSCNRVLLQLNKHHRNIGQRASAAIDQAKAAEDPGLVAQNMRTRVSLEQPKAKTNSQDNAHFVVT
jgi:hypothetical protein